MVLQLLCPIKKYEILKIKINNIHKGKSCPDATWSFLLTNVGLF